MSASENFLKACGPFSWILAAVLAPASTADSPARPTRDSLAASNPVTPR